MKPSIHIEIDGIASALVMDRLISLTITDEAGNRSDRLELIFDDRTPHLALPHKGVEIAVALGWGEAVPLGLFTVDDTGAAPGTVSIEGKAVSMTKVMKAPKTRSWEDRTLGQIVDAIAAEHGLEGAAASELASEAIPYLSQTAESDLALLTRLASERGASAKPKGGKLLFYPRGRQADALNADPVALSEPDFVDWQWNAADKPVYNSVRAWWRDHEAGERRQITLGSGEPSIELSDTYNTEQKARAAAQARLDRSKRKSGTLTGCKLARGNPRLRAEGRARIDGLREGPDGLWTLQSVTHRVTKEGFLSDFSAERALED